MRLIAKKLDSEENYDFEERAPYLIATFCAEVFEIDKVIRKMLGLTFSEEFRATYLSLDGEFPLLDRFASVAAKYLAAMLIIDEDGDLSDKLYGAYCDSMAAIQDRLPSVIEKIANKYK